MFDPERKCINCCHMGCLNYIRGTGICALLEGDTVILDEECVCPREVYEATEAFLKANGKPINK